MRIIAGDLRGRPIRAPAGSRTRPTTDRVREALFSILGSLDGLRIADLFAGSGALGLEALSRGAAHAVFVEPWREAVVVVRDNLRTLELSNRATIIAKPIERAHLELRGAGPFDLVLADPPWAVALASARDVALAVDGALSEGARVVLGHAARDALELPPELGLGKTDERAWGDSALSFFGVL